MDTCQIKYSKIMAAIDLSKYSAETFAHALSLAKALKAELVVLNVINTRSLDTVERYGGEGFGINRDKVLAQAKDDRAQMIEKELLSQAQGVSIRLVFREGLPWEQVLKGVEEEQPSMLVVGAKGHSDTAGILFGSVAEKVQRHATCPVLTVRGPGHCRTDK